jgi:AraC-like DNA-binding protein
MTFYGGKELAAGFRTVRKNTVIAASEIPEDRYGFRPIPETRTVAQQLVHIASAPRMQEQIQRVDWAELALDCGYYDQSHFANEFRAFSGIDATSYCARRTQWANHVPVE